MMKPQLAILAIVAALATTEAHASTTTINFNIENVFDEGNFFDLLGIAPVADGSGSFSFDPAAPAFNGPGSLGAQVDYANFALQALELSIGGLSFMAGPGANVNNNIYVQDAHDGYQDDVRVTAYQNSQEVTPGIFLNAIDLSFVDGTTDAIEDPDHLSSGLSFLTADVLNGFDYEKQGIVVVFNPETGEYGQAQFNMTFAPLVSTVPLPAGLPLLVGGLGLLGVLGLKARKQKAAGVRRSPAMASA